MFHTKVGIVRPLWRPCFGPTDNMHRLTEVLTAKLWAMAMNDRGIPGRALALAMASLGVAIALHAQNIGINATGAAPATSAMLDIDAANRGLLIPRVALTGANNTGPIALPVANSLLVFNTAHAGTPPDDVVPGYYWYNTALGRWMQLVDGSRAWTTTGNAGTNPVWNSIGTTDNVGLRVVVNNQQSGWLDPGVRATAAWGYQALFTNNGNFNTAVGTRALYSNGNSGQNTAVGMEALRSNGEGGGNTAIGYQTLWSNAGALNTAVGANTLRANSNGGYNSAVGASALNANTSGSNNSAVGYVALRMNTSGAFNTATGSYALYANTLGSGNTAHGYAAMRYNTLGEENSAFGREALYSNTTGGQNTAIGRNALYSNAIGTENSALGYNALYYNTSGLRNTAVGSQALNANSSGGSNFAGGFRTLYVNTSGSWNTALGNAALDANTTGFENTGIGNAAGPLTGALVNTTALGSGAAPWASNMVRVGGNMVTSIGGQVNWTTVSDARFKKDVRQDVHGLDFVMKLKPVTYHYDIGGLREHNGTAERDRRLGLPERDLAEQEAIRYTGFLAQEVEQAARETGYTFSGVEKPANEQGTYGLRYAEFVVPLVKAVQEQQQQIAEQRELIQRQAEQLQRLEERLRQADGH